MSIIPSAISSCAVPLKERPPVPVSFPSYKSRRPSWEPGIPRPEVVSRAATRHVPRHGRKLRPASRQTAFRGHTENLLSVHSRELGSRGVWRLTNPSPGSVPSPRRPDHSRFRAKKRLPARQNSNDRILTAQAPVSSGAGEFLASTQPLYCTPLWFSWQGELRMRFAVRPVSTRNRGRFGKVFPHTHPRRVRYMRTTWAADTPEQAIGWVI